MTSPKKLPKNLSHVSFDNHAMEDIKVFVTSPDHDVNDHPMAQTSFIVEGINDNHEDNNEASLLEVKPSINFDDIVSAERLAESLSEYNKPNLSRSTSQRSKHSQGSQHNHRRTLSYNRRRSKKEGSTPEDDDDEFCHRELVLKIRKTMPIKDFRSDIRANRDLEKFLVSPVVMLDVTHTSLDKIIGGLMEKLQKDLEVDEAITAEAEKAFFTLNQGQSFGASVDNLRETIEGIRYKAEGAECEQSWVTAVCSLPMLKRSHVGIARLRHPLNLGFRNEEVHFVIAVIAPKKEKFTKNAVEIGRTFSTMMMNSSFRHSLVEAASETEFKDAFVLQYEKYKNVAKFEDEKVTAEDLDEDGAHDYSCFHFGRGVYDDLKRRLPHYWSDFRDGIVGKNTPQKMISTVFFLYFACLLPDIAFGTVYEKQTDGIIGVRSCIIAQTMAGLLFAFLGGQPMLILVTTAPIALYVKVIKLVSDTFELDFRAMYTMTGIWNSIFLMLEGLFNLSKLMKYSSRSTEEIFEFFIALAFAADAIKETIANFKRNYHFRSELSTVANVTAGIFERSDDSNMTSSMVTTEQYTANTSTPYDEYYYRPENSILFLFLMLATLWVGITLLSFDESHFLSATKREILADSALPIAVISLSFVGSYLFRAIPSEQFVDSPNVPDFLFPDIANLPVLAHIGAIGLGLSLSCLFYVDQNIAASLINAPKNKLKKGSAYHWDLLIVGVLNLPLSFFALPWVHGAIPHSPLHLKALADVEYSVTNVGTAYEEVVKVRETRLTTIFSHILIGLSLLIIPVLQYIPVAVLEGVFLYLSISSFSGNQMFDRMLLLFTEGSSYPPNHYVRKVPQRKLHLFTFCQVVQLFVLCVFGFVDLVYMKMVFPIVFLLLLPIRHKILPKIVEEKYLTVLDS